MQIILVYRQSIQWRFSESLKWKRPISWPLINSFQYFLHCTNLYFFDSTLNWLQHIAASLVNNDLNNDSSCVQYLLKSLYISESDDFTFFFETLRMSCRVYMLKEWGFCSVWHPYEQHQHHLKAYQKSHSQVTFRPAKWKNVGIRASNLV